MKKGKISIKHIADDRCVGIYFETDLVNKTIVIGKGVKKRRFSLGEAECLEFLLRRQIDRVNGDYPKGKCAERLMGMRKIDSDGMEWFDTKEEARRFTKLQNKIFAAIEEEEYSYCEVLRAIDSIRNYYIGKGNDLLNSKSIQEVAKFGALLE